MARYVRKQKFNSIRISVLFDMANTTIIIRKVFSFIINNFVVFFSSISLSEFSHIRNFLFFFLIVSKVTNFFPVFIAKTLHYSQQFSG